MIIKHSTSHERIVSNPKVLVGKPTIKGTRISVELILEQLALNPNMDELCVAYPELSLADIQAALAYGGKLAGGHEVTPIPRRRERARITQPRV